MSANLVEREGAQSKFQLSSVLVASFCTHFRCPRHLCNALTYQLGFSAEAAKVNRKTKGTLIQSFSLESSQLTRTDGTQMNVYRIKRVIS